MKRILLPIALVLLFTLPSVSCSTILERFAPVLSSVALTLLLEIEDLLREFETASIDDTASSGDFLVFNALQDARYRNISNLLRVSAGQIPNSTLREYETRLGAAAVRAH